MPRRRNRSREELRRLDPNHLARISQARRRHVCPHLPNVVQTFFLGAALASGNPPGWNRKIGGPDRVLSLLVFDDDERRLIHQHWEGRVNAVYTRRSVQLNVPPKIWPSRNPEG